MAQGPVQIHRGAGIRGGGDDESENQRLQNCGDNFAHIVTIHHYLLVGRQVRQYLDSVTDGAVGDLRTTREQILDEALVCFAERGYEGTSLNDIAAGVGIRRPSLLHHFPNKETLYGDVFERLISEWMERLADAIASDTVGWVKFELVLRAGFDLFAANPDYVRIMRREALDGGVHLGIDLSGVLKPLFDSAAQYLQTQMDNGVFRRHNPQHLLITGYGAILTYFSDAPFVNGLIEEEALTTKNINAHCEHVISFFRSALLA